MASSETMAFVARILTYYWLLVLVAFRCSQAQHYPFTITCPAQIKSRLCKCYNDNSIACINAGLLEVPINLLPFAQSFNFDENRISAFDNLIRAKPLSALTQRSISIGGSGRGQQSLEIDIDDAVLNNDAPSPAIFNNVRDLYVSRNRLRTVASRSFWRLPQLEQLSLRYNYIQTIEPDALYGLQELKTLDLRNNKLSDLPPTIFSSLPKVKAILLSGNAIKRLDPQLFALNPQLKYIHLHQNPLDCTCFSSLYQLFQRPNTSLTGTCSSPFEVSGAPLAIAFDRLQCSEKHKISTLEQPPPQATNNSNDDDRTLTARFPSAPSNVPASSEDAASADYTPAQSSFIQHLSLAEQQLLEQTRREAAQRRRLTRQLTATVQQALNSAARNPPAVSSAASAISALPHFVHPPQDVQVRVGEPVNLRCKTNGYPKPESEWTKDNQPLRDPSVIITENNDVYIRQVTSHHAGVYTCRAWNAYGVSEASATVHVMVPPVIVKRLAASSTVNEGDLLTMSCLAEGLPRPQLTWTVNGRSIPTTIDHNVLNDGQQVRIERVTLEDAGEYHCTAQNSVGTAEAIGILTVVPRISRANLLLNNNGAQRASSGSSAASIFNTRQSQQQQQQQSSPSELLPQISPFAISNNNRFSPPPRLLNSTSINSAAAAANSPFVTNDISRRSLLPSSFSSLSTNSNNNIVHRGRYFNNNNSDNSLDGGDERQQTIENVVARARYQIERSVVRTIDRLKQEASVNPSTLFTAARFPSGTALDMAVSTDTFYRALELWRQQNPGRSASDEAIIQMARESGCGTTRPRPAGCSSCYHRKYRSFDGTCNNREHPLQGAALTPFLRRVPAEYEEDNDEANKNDVHYHPQGWNASVLYHGFPKPSARIVSVEILAADNAVPDPRHSLMLMQWGQFMDHDLDFALPAISQEQYSTGEQCGESCKNEAPCFPIQGHRNDARVNNRQCIEFTRNSGICQLHKGITSHHHDADGDDHIPEQQHFWPNYNSATSSTSSRRKPTTTSVLLPRQQVNQITSYIDASNVYGSDEVMARYLKTIRTGAFLRTGPSPISGGKPLLPFNDINNSPLLIECRQPLDRVPTAAGDSANPHRANSDSSSPSSTSAPCFLAGDPRANEQLGLLATHTVFVRHHNFVAETLLTLNPHWDGERVYQEARKILGAQLQHITFAEWLPVILGEHGMKLLEHDYAGYDTGVDASVSHAFMIAFRFGHTLIPPVLRRLNSSYQTHEQFGDLLMHEALFAPHRLVDEGGVDPLLRGLIATPAKLFKPDSIMTTEVTENLFKLAEHVALDLGAMNLQRGRDHGLPSYMEWRRFCNISSPNGLGSFDELRSDMKSDMVHKLQKLYGHPENIDLFAGATSETPLPGAIIGPTLTCIVADQFRRTRSGDRFWHENDGQFTAEQLQQIKRTSLAKIVCENSDTIKQVPRSAFMLPQSSEDFVECSSLPAVDYGAWKECCDACYLDDNDVSDTLSRGPSSITSRVVTNNQAHSIAAQSRASSSAQTSQQPRRPRRQWLRPLEEGKPTSQKNVSNFTPFTSRTLENNTLSARTLLSSPPSDTVSLSNNKISDFNVCVNNELNEFRRRIVQTEQLLSSSLAGTEVVTQLDELRKRLNKNELLLVALTEELEKLKRQLKADFSNQESNLIN